MPPVRPYRGISATVRTTQRREQLLAAGLAVVGRDGVAATTVGAVCVEAGLTKRYFYESFRDRDALLTALLDGFHRRLFSEIVERLATAPAAPVLRMATTIDLLVGALDDPRYARLYVEATAVPALGSLRAAAYEDYAQLLVGHVFGVAHPSTSHRVTALVLVTGVTQAVISWLSGDIDLDRAALVEHLTAVSVAAAAATA